MAARSSWKGYLKLSLVSVPVKAYTATSSEGGAIHLNQLHQECHSRIKYQKTCPIHGEVSNDQIVSGYEFSKGQYVIVDPAELEKLRTESDKSINVQKFIPSGALDPIYDSGRTYFLVPDGPVGQKPYALIHKAMQEEGCQAIAQVVISNREQLVRLRAIDKLISMTVLNYAAEVKQPAAFQDELVPTEASPQELALTRQLMQALTAEEFDIAQYKDVYTEKLSQLIQAKVAGEELVAAPAAAEPQIINLMEALKASVQQVGVPAAKAGEAKPPRKMAASRPKRAEAAEEKAKKKRKSG
jgi:DNA end-binding protein Ku